MKFPWQSYETRADSYTDAVVELIQSQASGTFIDPSRIAAREIALGLWGRAFASASVEPGGVIASALTPGVLALMGREMIRRGEALFLIEVEDGRLVLHPACAWNVSGGPNPRSWLYEITMAGPTHQTIIYNVSERRVVHVRYGEESDRPWLGVGPLQHASVTGKLAANIESNLADETSQSPGSLLPVPDGKSKSQLQADLRKIKGKLALVESTGTGWGDGSQGAPRRDLVQNRIGADPPDGLVKLRADTAQEVLAACGVPVTLLESTQGTALREAWRQFLHSSVTPVSLLASVELSDKLDTPLTLSFDRMMASDLSGRARAFQSMVGGGMAVERAAALAGLMQPD